MKYCTNCGEQINEQSKFCTGCGQETSSKKAEWNEFDKEKNFVEEVSEEDFEVMVGESGQRVHKNKKNGAMNKNGHKITVNNLNIWTLIYFIANIILIFDKHTHLRNVLLIISAIVLFFGVIRYKKNKPYNTALKLILGLQIAIGILLIGEWADGGETYINIFMLFFLVFSGFMLIFKGNEYNMYY